MGTPYYGIVGYPTTKVGATYRKKSGGWGFSVVELEGESFSSPDTFRTEAAAKKAMNKMIKDTSRIPICQMIDEEFDKKYVTINKQSSLAVLKDSVPKGLPFSKEEFLAALLARAQGGMRR